MSAVVTRNMLYYDIPVAFGGGSSLIQVSLRS